MNNREELNNTPKTVKGRKGKQKRVYAILTCVFALIFLCAAIWLIVYMFQNKQAEEHMEDIVNNYVQEGNAALNESESSKAPEKTTEPTATPVAEVVSDGDEAVSDNDISDNDADANKYPGLDGYNVPEKTIDFEALRKEQNEHIYAWVTVPGTVIDYPVLQHPEEIGYYLNRNLDHSKGYPGCIYSQLYNSKDWDDPITVLYGHNMKNGTMFAGLHQYGDSEFFAENPYVYIYTEDKIRVYEIFAAYEYTDVDLVLMYQLGGEEYYAEYLKSIYTLDGLKNNFNTELEVTTEDKVLTLETCIKNKDDRRYLVQAVLVAEGDAQ